MREKLTDQAEEKYLVNSGWILHPLRLKDNKIIHADQFFSRSHAVLGKKS